MKKNILVIYYSQSGQLKTIIDSTFSFVKNNCEIEYIEIKPKKDFPLPWKKEVFFDCMPESVLQIEEEIEPIIFSEKNYDLIVLGYQPWFLSPSIPFNSFLKSNYANFLKEKNILTIIGSRNMWLNAQEKTKSSLLNLGATLIGNIAFFDRNPNLLSVMSINRWSFEGIKEATRFLPAAGVQQKDIENASRFGPIILNVLENNQTQNLHKKLLELNAVELKPSLVLLEKKGITNFRKFAKHIIEKGERGSTERKSSVLLFRRLLWIGIFILSPITNVSAKIAAFLKQKKIAKEVEYFKNIDFKENAI